MEIIKLNKIAVPYVIFELIRFFDLNFDLLTIEGIFRKAGDSKIINKLIYHLTFRDYTLLRGGKESPMRG